MRIIVFGANGQFGTRIVKEALAGGHQVTAFVRKAESLPLVHENLTIQVGDVRRAADTIGAVQGHDAVISALGPGGPGVSDQHLDVLTEGIPHLIEGMWAAGIKRIVALGSVATLEATPGILIRDTPNFPAFARNISGAHLEAAQALAASGMEWTIVCPPLRIEAGERTGHYRLQDEQAIPGESRISYEDMAHFILNELGQRQHLYRKVNIAY